MLTFNDREIVRSILSENQVRFSDVGVSSSLNSARDLDIPRDVRKNMETKISKEIKRLRDLKGVSLEKAAEDNLAHFNPGRLLEVENGEEPEPRELYYLSKYYGVSYKDLLVTAGFIILKENHDTENRSLLPASEV